MLGLALRPQGVANLCGLENGELGVNPDRQQVTLAQVQCRPQVRPLSARAQALKYQQRTQFTRQIAVPATVAKMVAVMNASSMRPDPHGTYESPLASRNASPE